MTEDQQQDYAADRQEARPSAGKMLAEARERLGLSVADVARQLRLSPRQIEALEADDFARLPGKTFQRGFIRNYAKLLQLDPEPLLAGLEAQPQAQAIVVPSSRVEFGGKRRLLPFGDQPRKPWPKFATVAVVAVLVLSWVGYAWFQRQPAPSDEPVKLGGETMLVLPLPQPQEAAAPAAEPAPANAAAAPLPAPTPASATEEAGGKRLNFVFDGDSWVEVRDKSGKVIFSQKNPKGSQQSVSGVPPFSLVVGNAAHVGLSYNDKPVDLAPYTKVDVARLTLE